MPADISLQCRCGQVRGVALGVSPATTSHVVCYCDDCQAFARFLGTPGVMDAHGGTDIFHMAPSRLRITSGLDALKAVRLREKGRLLRWFAGCCRTPVSNTISARVPFVAIVHSFWRRDGEGPLPSDVLTPPVGIWGRFAIGGPLRGVHDKASPWFYAKVGANLLRWKITGQGRPSPFFDDRTGAPRAQPKILDAT
jgi:hypothetical protein